MQGQSDGASILFWRAERRLSFDDFQGKPPVADTTKQKVGSATHRLGTIVTALDVRVRPEKGRTIFTIYAAMDKKRSWIRNEGDAISLRHEQGHFDIAEIHARMLRRNIRKAKSLKDSELIYEQTMDAEERMHVAYDKDNTFLLGGTTEWWRAQLSKQLQNLNAYQQPTVIVALKD